MQHSTPSTLPIHPRTGLRAVYVSERTGRVYWPILGGSEPPEPPEPPTSPAYTAPASQADLDRIVEQRLARERAKYSDYDELKAKAGKHDALEAEMASDKDKAVSAAREEERAKALSEANPRIVRSEFKAAAKGALTDEQLSALLEDLDLSKYLTDKGDVDEDKVAKKVSAFAPSGTGKTPPPRNLGQGKQPPSPQERGAQARAQLEKRFPAKTAAQ